MRRAILIGAAICLIGGALAAPWGSGSPAQATDANVRRLAVRDRLAGIDPLNCGGPGNGGFAVGINLFESLYQYHYLKRPYTVIPCLATDLPEATADPLVWTIRLRDDVRFHDDACFPDGRGRLMIADDVAWTLRRIADPHAPAAAWPMLTGRIAGLDEFHNQTAGGTTADPTVSGIEVVNAHTLRLHLTRPWPQLPMVLAHPGTAIVPHEAVERYGSQFGAHAIGTGPYRLATLVPNVRIELTRWQGWRDERYPDTGEPSDAGAGLLADAGQKLPFIDRLEFTCLQADQPAWLMFLQGGFDSVGIPSANWSEVIGPDRNLRPEMAAQGLALEIQPAVFSRWIGFDMADPLIGGNLPLRRAISLAIDREGFNRTFLSSRSDLPRGIIPRMLPEHRADLHDPWMRFDPAQAKVQVAEAERLHGGPLPELTLRFGGKGPVQRQVGDLTTRWFEAVGLHVRMDYVDEDVLRAGLRDRPAQLSWGLGYSMRFPDPSDVFKSFRSGDAPANPFQYRNPEFDALYDRMIDMAGSPERTAICQRMEDLLLADLPCVVMLDYTWVSVSHDWLRNRKPHTFYGLGGQAKYERIDSRERSRWTGIR